MLQTKRGPPEARGPPVQHENLRNRKEIVMSISEDLAKNLQRIRQERNMSLRDLSEELGIPMSSTEKYCNGTGNPRADTLDMLSETLGIPITEIISAHPPVWEQAEIAGRAARMLSDLPPERRDRAIKLFLALVDVFSGKDRT